MMPWKESEINEIKVELESRLSGKVERLSLHLGRAKANVKRKIEEIEAIERVKSLAGR